MSRGGYLTATVRADELPSDAHQFNVKGGGFMIDLFARFPGSFFRVGQVKKHVDLCLVTESVSRDTVLDALNHLTEKMGFLEKVKYGERGKIQLYKYRRKLTETQRDLSERGLRKKRLPVAVQRAVNPS